MSFILKCVTTVFIFICSGCSVETAIHTSWCKLPLLPENGMYRDEPVGIRKTLSVYNEVLPETKLVYTCDDDYTLTSNINPICLTGGTWNLLPKCEKRCQLNYSNMKIICKRFGSNISCKDMLLNGTVAEMSCKQHFKTDDTIKNPYICINGDWNKPLPSCKTSIMCTLPLNSSYQVMNNIDAKPGDLVPVNTKIVYACDMYTDIRSNISFCATNRKWRGSECTKNPALVNDGEFTHMVNIYRRENGTDLLPMTWKGFLLNYNYAITLASCTYYNNTTLNMNVLRVGNAIKFEFIAIEIIIRHPLYNHTYNRSHNNLALIKLGDALNSDVKKNVYPACLYENSKFDHRPLYSIGLSRYEDPEIYKKVKLTLANSFTCDRFPKNTELNAKGLAHYHFCGFDKYVRSSGSPLHVMSKTKECKYEVVGISVMFRYEISYFIKLYPFNAWIKENIKP